MEVGAEGLQAKPGWKLLPADLSGQPETKTMAGVGDKCDPFRGKK